MAGILLFALGLVLGFAVNPWLFALCAVPILATAIWGRP